MNHKERIHLLLKQCAEETLAFIKERESFRSERWVPAVEIKRTLALDFVPYPRESGHNDPKGWLFAIIARMLEDLGVLEYKREGSRAFCRSRRP
jgi:hypothetical protein